LIFADLKCGQCSVLHRIYWIKEQLCYLSTSKVKDKDRKPELQIIISFSQSQNAQQTYKERWLKETLFRRLKSSGFNIEDTRLGDLESIKNF
jgi:hypothetical protein